MDNKITKIKFIGGYIGFVFLLLFIGVGMSIIRISPHMQQVFTIFTVIYFVYRTFYSKANIGLKDMRYAVVEVTYFIVFTVIYANLSETNIRAAFQNIIPLITYLILYIGIRHDGVCFASDKYILAYIRIVTVVSVINIILTVISIIRGDVQEGYRYMMNGIIIGIYIMVMYKRYNPKYKLLIPLSISVLAVIASYSKQAYLSLVVIAVMLLVTSKNKEKAVGYFIKALIIISLGMILLIVVAKYNNRVQTLIDAALYNFKILINRDSLLNQETYRMTEIKEAMTVFVEHPLLGIGSGTWYTAFGLQTWVHCNWVWFLLDFGVVGTMVFFVPLFLKLFKVLSFANKIHRQNYKLALLCYIPTGAVGLVFFNGLFAPVFFRDPMCMSIFALCISCCDALLIKRSYYSVQDSSGKLLDKSVMA